jgi:hypothetical protein
MANPGEVLPQSYSTQLFEANVQVEVWDVWGQTEAPKKIGTGSLLGCIGITIYNLSTTQGFVGHFGDVLESTRLEFDEMLDVAQSTAKPEDLYIWVRGGSLHYDKDGRTIAGENTLCAGRAFVQQTMTERGLSRCDTLWTPKFGVTYPMETETILDCQTGTFTWGWRDRGEAYTTQPLT